MQRLRVVVATLCATSALRCSLDLTGLDEAPVSPSFDAGDGSPSAAPGHDGSPIEASVGEEADIPDTTTLPDAPPPSDAAPGIDSPAAADGWHADDGSLSADGLPTDGGSGTRDASSMADVHHELDAAHGLDATQDSALMEDAGAPSDSSSDRADTSSAEPDATAPPLVARLNIGGPAYVGHGYPGLWAASPVPGVCGPNHYETSNALHGTLDAPLFQSEAYGNPATCAVGSGLAPGKYEVRLYFAEVYWGSGCVGGGGIGSRVFNIVLEGQTVLTGLDILAESGGCLASTTSKAGAPVVKTFDVEVRDGTLNISLVATADNGKLSALELFGPF